MKLINYVYDSNYNKMLRVEFLVRASFGRKRGKKSRTLGGNKVSEARYFLCLQQNARIVVVLHLLKKDHLIPKYVLKLSP